MLAHTLLAEFSAFPAFYMCILKPTMSRRSSTNYTFKCKLSEIIPLFLWRQRRTAVVVLAECCSRTQENVEYVILDILLRQADAYRKL